MPKLSDNKIRIFSLQEVRGQIRPKTTAERDRSRIPVVEASTN